MSKTKTKSVNYSIYQLMAKHKKTMSYATFSDRTQRLVAMFKELHDLGYETTNIARVKQKHIKILVDHWQKNNVSIGSIKNRMSDLRFICDACNRKNVVQSNEAYAIGNRSYVPTENKATLSTPTHKISDEYIRCSVELQRVFGLRREECLKIIPKKADKGALLQLDGSWTKGGIARAIPIKTEEQRYWINQAKSLVKDASLIPQKKTYIEQRNTYNRLTKLSGIKNSHGFRHAYAQKRYLEVTGWHAPIAGGKERAELTKLEFQLDRKARKIIALELGHSRIAIAKNYLG